MPREGNQIADFLAKPGAKGHQPWLVFDNLPEDISHLLLALFHGCRFC